MFSGFVGSTCRRGGRFRAVNKGSRFCFLTARVQHWRMRPALVHAPRTSLPAVCDAFQVTNALPAHLVLHWASAVVQTSLLEMVLLNGSPRSTLETMQVNVGTPLQTMHVGVVENTLIHVQALGFVFGSLTSLGLLRRPSECYCA